MPRQSPLQTAQQLAAQGLNVIPAGYREKAPVVRWKPYQTKRTDPMLASWFGSTPRNYWVMTGRMSGHVVLDCDSEAGERYWRERIPDEILDTTACVKTAKGHHYWFRLDGDDLVGSWAMHPTIEEPDRPSFDVRAEETGVLVPPSVHPDGTIYAWLRPLEAALPVPDALRSNEAGSRRGAGTEADSDGVARSAESRGGAVSMLSRLLASPAAEGGRNDWMTKVAGHYAKTYRNQLDLYELHCQRAALLLSPPLEQREYRKTVESIWGTEHEQHPERALDARAGWLIAGDHCLCTQVVVGRGDDASYTLAEWGDFDLRVKGVIAGADDGDLLFDLTLLRRQDRAAIDTVLPARTLGDPRRTAGWLAGHGVSIAQPENVWPRHPGSPSTRLLRYLTAQNAPRSQMADHLGWHSQADGFLTFEGVIKADGLHPYAGVRPDPLLAQSNRAPFSYGFVGGEREARRVLTEVLTFHDETVAAVFGAWWAACLLKPQIEELTALFPLMAIEAASEAGKTTGFFNLMIQLNGNHQGETQSTKAASRDAMGAHRSGIVWLDDLDDPGYLFELLRVATGSGSIAKKGNDNTENVVARLVAPVVLSGEALGMGEQKALLDRSVLLKVPSPVGRRSLKGEWAQWDDIVALREQYPPEAGGLTAVAGTLTQLALGQAGAVRAALPGLRDGDGRAADKTAILRAGGRLLDCLAGHDGAWDDAGPRARLVDEFAKSQQNHRSESWDNALTLRVLPWALRSLGWPSSHRNLPPVFIERDLDDEVLGFGPGPVLWFAPALLAEAWEQERRGRIEKRTETAEALRDQARAAGLGGDSARKQYRAEARGRQVYWRVDKEIATSVLRRSRGEE